MSGLRMGRAHNLNLAALGAVLGAGVIALAGCSSSAGSGTNTGANDAGGNTSSSSTSSAATTTTSSSTSSSSSSTAAGCFSGTLNAAGSTAQANAMTKWISDFQKKCPNATVNYNPTGSGDGVTAFENKQIDFAGSDASLVATDSMSAAQKACGGNAPIDLPMVGGPIAVGYKLNGVNKLVLNGPTLANIFLGKITTWNDPQIQALNKGVKLPATKITPFYRSDSSGTTYNFEEYLSQNAGSIFKATPDTDSSGANFAGQGKTGSQGVAQAVTSTNGGIGYFEYSYAVQSSLPTVEIDNGSGPVQISPDAASAAINSGKVVGKGKDLSMSLDYATKTKGAYPITLVTYEVVCSKYPSSATATKVKDFLSYIVSQGQSELKSEAYAPLPSSLQSKVAAAIKGIS